MFVTMLIIVIQTYQSWILVLLASQLGRKMSCCHIPMTKRGWLYVNITSLYHCSINTVCPSKLFKFQISTVLFKWIYLDLKINFQLSKFQISNFDNFILFLVQGLHLYTQFLDLVPHRRAFKSMYVELVSFNPRI